MRLYTHSQDEAHKVERSSHSGVIGVEPFSSDRFGLDGVVASEGSSSAMPVAFVVVHAGLDAVRSRSPSWLVVPDSETAGAAWLTRHPPPLRGLELHELATQRIGPAAPPEGP
jgi:hypothetical protein